MKSSIFFKVLPLLAVLGAVSPGHGMVALEENEMSQVSGAGLAFVLDDFSMRMAPTSFIELTGSQPKAPAVAAGWRRGDARYYGLSMTSGAGTGTDWFGDGCVGGGLACPLGTKAGGNQFGVGAFASVFDPFILRVFEYTGFDYQGAWRGQGVTLPPLPGGTSVLPIPTILEFSGPSNTDVWRWSFWGLLEVNRGGACPSAAGNTAYCGLRSQTIILGKPVAQGFNWRGRNAAGVDLGYQAGGARPAILRLMRTQNNADPTLGITYQSAISGDFRFSVRQQAGAPVGRYEVPNFNDQEGMFFKNVDAFLPIGTLHYQALTFGGVSRFNASASPVAPVQNGNFFVELTRIPNVPNVYNHFYCGNTNGNCQLDAKGSVLNPNPNTHGYVRWGNWCTNAACSGVINPYTAIPDTGAFNLPTATSTANGIYFVGGSAAGLPQNNVTNLGISRIEGMLIQHLKITTLGAGS